MLCCKENKKKVTFLTKMLSKIFVPEEEATSRLALCRECEHLNETFVQCKICGCFMEAKTKLQGFHCADKENPKW